MNSRYVQLSMLLLLLLSRFSHVQLFATSWTTTFPGFPVLHHLLELAQILVHYAMQETWVLSLCQEDPLEKGMATHSSILAWEILWTEEPGRL